MNAPYQSVQWREETHSLRLLDQTQLPETTSYLDCTDVESVWQAIKRLSVRGAPAIGIAAAYGVVVALYEERESLTDVAGAAACVEKAADHLAASRPTAVNLFWALERMRRRSRALAEQAESIGSFRDGLLAEAQAIHEEDRQMCRAIGRHGAELLGERTQILTHCNTGGLATAEYGTALAVCFTMHEQGKPVHVVADETRPLLQGARLTMWELQQYGVPSTLICDSMAAQVMREGRVEAVITGADRIAANGDAANKIGTYGVAVLAKAHGIPFYVAAPTSTFDLSLDSGEAIPIEQRAAEEITCGFGRRTAPAGVEVYNPAFDVTPANLIAGIITERGVISPVNREEVERVVVRDRGVVV